MPTALIQASLLGALMLLSLTVQAKVEVEAAPHSNLGSLLIAKVSEDIAPGDYETLLKGLRANPGTFKRKIVLLDNIGGSTAEAMRMGRLLRETGFDALVPSSGLCQGGCVYLLAAAHKKTVKGHVALHRPLFAGGDSALAQAARQGQPQRPATYFRDMQIPARLAEDMQRIAPQQLRLLTPQELARYRLN